MKKMIIMAVLVSLAGIAAAFATGGMETVMTDTQNAKASAAVKITAEQAYERIHSGDPVVILDVRRADEYASSHIPGAILIPNEEIGTEVLSQLPVLDTEILVYCRSGNRSGQAAAKMAKAGYTNIKDFGGINDWPYETETGAFNASEKEGKLSSFRSWDIYGRPVDESIFAGSKLTMINIWGTFCGPCLREMPSLGELSEEYDEAEVQIVGIVVDATMKNGVFASDVVKKSRSIVSQTGADYLHILPSSDLEKAKLSNVNAVPETIFVDSTGSIVGKSYIGSRSKTDWEKIIDLTLAGMN